jgi:cephalosporin-C deacetylase-like acetyl esterase
MKKIVLYIGLIIMTPLAFAVAQENQLNITGTDTLPNVLAQNRSDITGSKLKNEAFLRFAQHQLPTTKQEWENDRTHLRNEIIKKAGVIIDHQLPLNYQETGTEKMEGYSIKNIIFQTRPGVYATANLYIPDGKGPFPAVINMNGHWTEARMAEMVQSVGHTLALNGYVCLNIDAFGSGERTTKHGEYEYHGYGLGASLMNLGESLMGFQISDNIRGVDLLCSLPYVDAKHIGATGASGGGNQTLWLTAIDERIKASMPVVSVGTFESYVMEDNCICELLVDGLTFTEEAGILGLVAPRAIKMCNHNQDDIPPFFPPQMLRSYKNASPVFKMLGVEKNISYQLFDRPHGYWPEDRSALLGWFNLHLKGIGDGTPAKESPFKILLDTQLMVYSKGKRDSKVASIAEYCERKGIELRNNLLSARAINAESKKKELKSILRITDKPSIKNVHEYSNINGWDRFALETSDDKLIPVLHLSPRDKTLGYFILCNAKGKGTIPSGMIDDLKKKGYGIVIPDLSGTGETSSPKADTLDGAISFHTMARAELWLGRTVMGEWVNELDLITGFLKSKYHAQRVSIDGSREAGLAALFLGALEGSVDNIVLRDAPVSYLFDNRDSINFYSMAIHIPGFLKWGDVSLTAALCSKDVRFINPLTISGQKLSNDKLKEYQEEFNKVKRISKKPGHTLLD